MSPLKTSLFAALLAAAITAGVLYLMDQSRGRKAARLRAHNHRMRVEASRQVAAKMAAAEPRAVAAPEVSAGGRTAVPTAPLSKPAENYRNEGQATPLAALQTFAWACDRGDVETVERLLHIDDTARVKVEAYREGLPDPVRRQWKTLDEMAAVMLTRSVMARPFPNADVLETATIEEIGADRVRLRLPNVPRDGTVYQKTAGGWKYVITEAMVDDYLQRMKTPERAAR